MINNILWWCAGANRELLRKCPNDQAKYFGLGATILFTGIMASVAGGYAFYFVFNSVPSSFAFGAFWGLLIFNLDRYIVTSTKRSDNLTTWEVIKYIGPRIILAVLLGVIVATPLKLKIFDIEIHKQLKLQEDLAKEEHKKTLNGDYAKQKEIKHAQIEQEKALNKRLEAQWLSAEKAYKIEHEQGNAFRSKGYGPSAKAFERRAATAKESYDVSKATLDSLQKELIEIESGILSAQERRAHDNLKNVGFLDRMRAFSNMSKKDNTVLITGLFVYALFIIIEVTPVIFKLLSTPGAYEDQVEAATHIAKIEAQKAISDLNTEVRENIEAQIELGRERIKSELETSREILAKLSKAQIEIANEAIEVWKGEELESNRISSNKVVNLDS